MGKVWPPEAVAQHQSTATSNISRSPNRASASILFTGSDDGVIQMSYDAGQNWRRPSGRQPPDYGNYGVYVQRVVAGKSSESTVYALYDNTKNGDFKPYLYKSTDRGATWTSIAGDLPANGPTLSFAEDHVNPDLLFVGTEWGLFVTVDGGKKWIRMRNNLPTIAVRDLAIQERENDLVLATFGRGFYVLDDYSPLRQATAANFQKDGFVFTPKTATIEVPEQGRARGSQGEALWMAENRPIGAAEITYWIREAPQTLKQKRQAAMRAAEQKKETPKYPTQAELTAEADEEAPQTFLTVTDGANKIVRRLVVPGNRGIHRFSWNLRGIAAAAGGGGFGGGGGGGGNTDDGGPPPPRRLFVAPATYRLALPRRVGTTITNLVKRKR